MKKKAVALMLSAVMVMGMASAVSVQAGVADKTLIVGFDAEYPPYGLSLIHIYRDPDDLAGGTDCLLWRRGRCMWIYGSG